eukprot:NODE_187_length_13529_cov_1.102606.p8 type:complete len:147 gc:universal NODE_187_length_13529_cov_1.102606:6590-7030(+)
MRKKYRIFRILFRSIVLYFSVLIINNLSRRSKGIPWGLLILVPLIFTLPLLLAMITIGANSSSNMRFKNEKHSISNMFTSSINRIPGSNFALPSSIQVWTLVFTWSLTEEEISPVAPSNNAKKPFCRELITSISCRETTCSSSFCF